jgi:hypothetical protein
LQFAILFANKLQAGIGGLLRPVAGFGADLFDCAQTASMSAC